jgi:hypothetical protein
MSAEPGINPFDPKEVPRSPWRRARHGSLQAAAAAEVINAITWHADRFGNNECNQTVSQRRASAAKAY